MKSEFGELEDISFGVIILSHGRAGRIDTLKTLKREGYTGDLWILCDDEDEELDEYKRLYGDKVIVFNKQEAYERTDTMNCEGKKASVVYARNEAFRVARDLGLDVFLELDDDYTGFEHRWVEGEKLKAKEARDLNKIFAVYVKFLVDTGADCVTTLQGGYLIGGAKRFQNVGVIRKGFNVFFFWADSPVEFKGATNEDMVMTLLEGQRGRVILGPDQLSVKQRRTQKNPGGLTDIYLDEGTYVKSFYAVMAAPSCTKISELRDFQRGRVSEREHHKVSWVHAVPQIINERWKKR